MPLPKFLYPLLTVCDSSERNSDPVIDSFTETLSLLTLELRDPDQDLFVQHPGQAATEFPRFSKLPTEICLMIWRAAFRGPKLIRLTPQCSTDTPTYRPPHPSTLHVSKESRAETLRHYLMLFLNLEECLVPAAPAPVSIKMVSL